MARFARKLAEENVFSTTSADSKNTHLASLVLTFIKGFARMSKVVVQLSLTYFATVTNSPVVKSQYDNCLVRAAK